MMPVQFISYSEYQRLFCNFTRDFSFHTVKHWYLLCPVTFHPDHYHTPIWLPTPVLHCSNLFKIYLILTSELVSWYLQSPLWIPLFPTEILKYWKLTYWNWKLKCFALTVTEVQFVFYSYLNKCFSIMSINSLLQNYCTDSPKLIWTKRNTK